ncbi:TetR/AcrR family transcriptional regulator [Bacillus sp. 1P06AnD]|uniref:TetR/AcrR family transcriptional regulator n=1 Tax=Bacillus sp. 1P06AnD TaxID=3132208 RepID=UPI00399FABE3
MRDNIFALHQKNIADEAESLFIEKGFNATSVTDICQKSGYSRRTIYKYFANKEEILNYLVIKGLEEHMTNIEEALHTQQTFISRYEQICECLLSYYENHQISAQTVEQFQHTGKTPLTDSSERIFSLGKKINELLAQWVKGGIEEGVLDRSTDIMPAVYIFSSNVNALFKLISTKGPHLFDSLHMTKEQFLSYGYHMNLRSLVHGPI